MIKRTNSIHTTIFQENQSPDFVYFIIRGKYEFLKTINFNSKDILDKLKQNQMLMNFKANKHLEQYNQKEITLSVFQKGEIFGFTDIILKQ